MKKMSVMLVLLVGFIMVTSAGFNTSSLILSEVTLIGNVVGSDFDDDDNVVSIAISVHSESDDEEDTVDYEVKNDNVGKELFKFVGKRVEVKGQVSEDEDGYKFIKVKSYKLLD